MYTVASPNPNPGMGGGQLPDPNKCNSTLTGGTRGEALIPNPNEWNWEVFQLPLYMKFSRSIPVPSRKSETHLSAILKNSRTNASLVFCAKASH